MNLLLFYINISFIILKVKILSTYRDSSQYVSDMIIIIISSPINEMKKKTNISKNIIYNAFVRYLSCIILPIKMIKNK